MMTYNDYSKKQIAKGYAPMTKAQWDQMFVDAKEKEEAAEWYRQDRINHPEAY